MGRKILIPVLILAGFFILAYPFEFLNTHAELNNGLLEFNNGLRIRADSTTLRVNEEVNFTLDHLREGTLTTNPESWYGFIVLKKDRVEVARAEYCEGTICFFVEGGTASFVVSFIPRSTGSWTAQATECPEGQSCNSPAVTYIFKSNTTSFTVNPAVNYDVSPPSITISVDPRTVDVGDTISIFSTVNNLLPDSGLRIAWQKVGCFVGNCGFGGPGLTDGHGNLSPYDQHSVPPTTGNWQVWIEYLDYGEISTNRVDVTVREAPPPPPLPTLTFTSDPAVITIGQSSILSWFSADTTICNASTFNWTTDGSTSGNRTISPGVTTTYGLSCTGLGGSINKRVTVTVNDSSGDIEKYACNSDNQCVADPDGTYTSSDCNNECRSGGDDDDDDGGVGPIGGLVPCGRSQDDPSTTDRDERNACTTCDIFVLGSRVINFILFTVTPAIAVLLFLIAGFMILLGGANPGLINSGKNIFRTTVYGLLLVFGAWMITNTILKSLAGNYFDGQRDPWNRVVCREPGAIVPPPPPPPPPALPDLALGQPIASDLISMGVNFSTSADCGNDFHASQNIQDIANAEFPAVCSSTCNCLAGGPNGNVSVNWLILQGLKELYNEMTSAFGVGFTVTSFTTGRHSTNSSHYTGEGVDIVISSSNPSDWQAARAFLDSLGGNAICERTSDSSDDTNCNLANINHIHWTLRR